MDERQCNTCGETKPLDHYSKSKRSRGGHMARCKACSADASRLRRAGGVLDLSPDPPPDMKRCGRCKKTYRRDHYTKSAKRKDGLHPICKACQKSYRDAHAEEIKERGQRYYQENKARLNERSRAYRRENREYFRAKGREHYRSNKDRYREWSRRWAEENRDKVNDMSRKWREANPGKRKAAADAYYWRNRDDILAKAREKYSSDSAHAYYLSRRDEILAHQRANPHIAWSSSYRTRARRLGMSEVVENFTKEDVIERYGDSCFYCESGAFEHLDHYVPVKNGGLHTLENVRPSCAACNVAKSDLDPAEWLAEQAELDDLTEDELDELIDAEIERWTK